MRSKVLTLLAVTFMSQVAIAQSAKSGARMNHTAIFVTDIKASADFYQSVVGLDTIPEPFHDGKHVWLRTGPGMSLHIIEGAKEKKQYFKNQHTCFSVGSVDAFAEILKTKKIEFEDLTGNKNVYSKRVDGIKQLWVRDPDGYWVEINDAKE